MDKKNKKLKYSLTKEVLERKFIEFGYKQVFKGWKKLSTSRVPNYAEALFLFILETHDLRKKIIS